MALRERQICRKVTALVRRSEAAREAEALGLVDVATIDPSQALPTADIVIYTTPVRVIIRQLQKFVPFFKSGAIITDMGSTKQQIVQAMVFPEHL